MLTAAQSLFALGLLLRLRLSVLGAAALAMLFAAQLTLAFVLQDDPARRAGAHRLCVGYMALALGLFALHAMRLTAILKSAAGK